jgi:hypothetical protein
MRSKMSDLSPVGPQTDTETEGVSALAPTILLPQEEMAPEVSDTRNSTV